MPTILSFDIGTRHLAYCALQHTPATTTHPKSTHITHWQVVDLMAVMGTPYDEECVWVTSKSWKVGALRAYLDQRHLSSVGTRDVLLKRIQSNLKQRGVAKVTSTNLCVLASKLYAYLDTQRWMLECNTIVLENQPCLTNPVMKSVQMLLYGYFLYNGVWQTHQSNKRLQQSNGQSNEPSNEPSNEQSNELSNEPSNELSGGGAETVGPTALQPHQPLQSFRPLPRVMLTSATNKLKVCQTVLKDDEPTAPTETTTDPANSKPNNTDPNNDTKPTKPTKPSKAKSNYKQRKQDAIALTSKLLLQWRTESTTPDEMHRWTVWMEKMEGSCMKEKDDLSDSFLQGLYVLRQHVVEKEKKKEKEAKKAKAMKKKKEKTNTKQTVNHNKQ